MDLADATQGISPSRHPWRKVADPSARGRGRRACGYEDTSIVFIPLFGGAAVGRKLQASVHERMLVLLAGPLPGIALAVGAYLWLGWNNRLHYIMDEVPFLFTLGLLLWAINVLNLLPILPLDGGRVVNDLLFSRNPHAEILFNLFAVLVLFGAGLATGDFILLMLA